MPLKRSQAMPFVAKEVCRQSYAFESESVSVMGIACPELWEVKEGSGGVSDEEDPAAQSHVQDSRERLWSTDA
jgi:hypothetical protein